MTRAIDGPQMILSESDIESFNRNFHKFQSDLIAGKNQFKKFMFP